MSSEERRKKKIRRDLYYEGNEEIYHDLFSGDVFTHIYTHVYTHVYYFVTNLSNIRQSYMDHGCEGLFGIVAMECERIYRSVYE